VTVEDDGVLFNSVVHVKDSRQSVVLAADLSSGDGRLAVRSHDFKVGQGNALDFSSHFLGEHGVELQRNPSEGSSWLHNDLP